MKYTASPVEHPLRRRQVLTVGVGMLALPPTWQSAWAQEAPYPQHTVRLVVPFSAGSSPDMRGRALAEMAKTTPGGLAVPQVRGGRLRALAYAGAQRNTALPDVPTYAEAGCAGVEFHVLLALLGPAGLPAAVVERLGLALRLATQDAGLQAQFEASGAQAVYGSPEQTAAVLRRDTVMVARLIAQLRITPE